MKLVTYRRADEGAARPTSIGVLLGQTVVDVHALLEACDPNGEHLRMSSLEQLFRRPELVARLEGTVQDSVGHDVTEKFRGCAYSQDEITFLPPVLRPGNVMGVGMNYRTFVEQIDEEVPEHPNLFHKTAASLIGHRGNVLIPINTDQPVPEGEVAVFVGRHASRVPPETAMDYVGGYACANDISARNLEFLTSQWTGGKMVSTFCPIGPTLVTPSEIADPRAISISTAINGQVVQSGNTENMIFDLAELISRISWLTPLSIGDVILTGTPSDLGETSPPTYLRPGDEVSVTCSGLGTLINAVELAST